MDLKKCEDVNHKYFVNQRSEERGKGQIREMTFTCLFSQRAQLRLRSAFKGELAVISQAVCPLGTSS